MNIETDRQECRRYCSRRRCYHYGTIFVCSHGAVWHGGRGVYVGSPMWERLGPIRTPIKWRRYLRAKAAEMQGKALA